MRLPVFILWTAVLLAAPSWAATDQTGPSEDDRARAYFTDTELVTQNGETVRFYSDMLKGKVVLVSLFFTECTGMCPTINASLAEVQELLGDRMGKDIVFISITLDPETDTPDVVREYAANFDAGKGWYFLTGKLSEIKTVTRKMGHAASTPAEHTGTLILGNVATATWTKMTPGVPPLAVAEKLKLLAEGGHAQK